MILVSFSGLDGSGKSTQVAALCEALAARGVQVYRMVPLYASVTGAVTLLREWRRRRRPRTHSSAPAPATPRAYGGGRTFTSDRLTRAAQFRRAIIYPLDCLALAAWIGWRRLRGDDVVVCDRYLYDKLVNLPSPAGRLARLLRRLTPRPDAAFFLDVNPTVASTRRTEHAPDYYLTKYAAYRALIDAGFGLETVCGASIDETRRLVLGKIETLLDRGHIARAAEAATHPCG